MSARLETIPSGIPALNALVTAIKEAKSSDALGPVTVIAPSMRSAVGLRRDVAHAESVHGRGGIANVRFTVLSRLAELVAAEPFSSVGRRPLDRSTLGAAIRAELSSHRGFLAPAIAHPSCEAEFALLYEQMRFADPSSAEALPSSRRDSEVIAILASVRTRLATQTYDDVDLFEGAVAQITDGSFAKSFGPVVVHLPQRMRRCEAQFLAQIARVGSLVVQWSVVDFADNSFARELIATLDAALAESGDRSTEPLFDRRYSSIGGTRFDTLVVAPTPIDEVREAVGAIGALLRDDLAPHRIGISYTSAVPYLRLVAHELETASLPWSGPCPDVLGAAPSARFLQRLLSLAPGTFSRHELFSLLASARVLDRNGRAVPVGEWERCSRLARIVSSDRSDWRSRLSSLRKDASSQAATLSALLDDADHQLSSSRRRRDRAARTVAASDSLERFVEELFATVESLDQHTTWSSLSAGIRSALDRYLGPETLRSSQSFPYGETDRRIVLVLEELAALDAVNQKVDRAEFAAALDVALSRPGPPIGRVGSGVVVGELGAFAALRLDTLFVLGCVEGALPRDSRQSALLSRSSRILAGLDRPKETVIAEQEHRLLVARGATNTCIASMPERDGHGQRNTRLSRFVSRDVPSARSSDIYASVDASSNEHREVLSLRYLRCEELLRLRDDREIIDSSHVLSRDQALVAGLSVVSSRSRMAFDRHGGFVSSSSVADGLFSDSFSPTTLEDYASCPFRFFLRHGLGLEVIDLPEQRLSIDPRIRGTIVHEILERFYRESITASEEEVLTRRDGGVGGTSSDRLVQIADAVLTRYEQLGLTGRRAIWGPERRRLLRELAYERELDDERRRRDGYRPVAVEYEFGTQAEVPPVVVETSIGTLRFRGKVDRIDVSPFHGVNVIDYKTGRSDSFRGLKDDPVDKGRHLQLPIYAWAAKGEFSNPDSGNVVKAVFRFVGRDEEVAYVDDDESAARFHTAVETIVGSIRRGVFPVHPGPLVFGGYENCKWCEFDHLCPADRVRRWEEASECGQTADYASLCGDEDDKVSEILL